jgi:ACS family glucarate transporter-like MFS transporter
MNMVFTSSRGSSSISSTSAGSTPSRGSWRRFLDRRLRRSDRGRRVATGSATLGPRWGCRIPGIAGLLAVAVLLFFGAAAPNAYLAIALLSLCFAGNQFTEGAYWEGTTYVGGRYATAACGVLNTGGNFAGIVATPMVPLLKDEFGWFVALASGSVFAVIGAVLWLFIRADRVILDVSDAR